MTATARRALYDSPAAARRIAQDDAIAKLTTRHHAEAKTHRAALSSSLAKLADKHQAEAAEFGNYRLPDRVLKSQKEEQRKARSDHRILGEKIERRQNLEMAEAKRTARSSHG